MKSFEDTLRENIGDEIISNVDSLETKLRNKSAETTKKATYSFTMGIATIIMGCFMDNDAPQYVIPIGLAISAGAVAGYLLHKVKNYS